MSSRHAYIWLTRMASQHAAFGRPSLRQDYGMGSDETKTGALPRKTNVKL